MLFAEVLSNKILTIKAMILITQKIINIILFDEKYSFFISITKNTIVKKLKQYELHTNIQIEEKKLQIKIK